MQYGIWNHIDKLSVPDWTKIHSFTFWMDLLPMHNFMIYALVIWKHWFNELCRSSLGCHISFSSVQSLSHVWLFATPWVAAQSCLTLCNPMSCSTPGLPVHHQLPEFTQIHVHWVGNTIQSSHPLSSPSLAFNLSQHQGLFQWVSSLHQVAKLLELPLQHQSFQWIPRTDFH